MIVLAAFLFSQLLTLGTASYQETKGTPGQINTILAQQLVHDFAKALPELKSLEIALNFHRGCGTAAATDPKDVGEKCAHDEHVPRKTGNP